MLTRFALSLVLLGSALMLLLGWQGFGAYAAIQDMDIAARVDTPNPVLLFDSLTTAGINVNSQIDARSRGDYTRALERFVLSGTGVLLGIVFVAGGVFLRVVSD